MTKRKECRKKKKRLSLSPPQRPQTLFSSLKAPGSLSAYLWINSLRRTQGRGKSNGVLSKEPQEFSWGMIILVNVTRFVFHSQTYAYLLLENVLIYLHSDLLPQVALCFRWAPMRLLCQRLLFPAGPALPFWIQELLGGNFTLRSRWLEVHECVISPGDLGSVLSWLFSVVIHRVGRDWLDNQGFGLAQFSSALVWYKDHLRKRPWELLESRPNSDKEAMPVAHRSVVPGPVTTPSGNLRKIQILGPLPRPNESKTLGVGPAIHVLKSHSSNSDSCSNLKTIGLRASHPWLHTWGICLKYRIWSGAQKIRF